MSNDEIGNGDEAVAFEDSPSKAFAPLNVHWDISQVPPFAVAPETLYAQPSKYSHG